MKVMNLTNVWNRMNEDTSFSGYYTKETAQTTIIYRVRQAGDMRIVKQHTLPKNLILGEMGIFLSSSHDINNIFEHLDNVMLAKHIVLFDKKTGLKCTNEGLIFASEEEWLSYLTEEHVLLIESVLYEELKPFIVDEKSLHEPKKLLHCKGLLDALLLDERSWTCPFSTIGIYTNGHEQGYTITYEHKEKGLQTLTFFEHRDSGGLVICLGEPSEKGISADAFKNAYYLGEQHYNHAKEIIFAILQEGNETKGSGFAFRRGVLTAQTVISLLLADSRSKKAQALIGCLQEKESVGYTVWNAEIIISITENKNGEIYLRKEPFMKTSSHENIMEEATFALADIQKAINYIFEQIIEDKMIYSV